MLLSEGVAPARSLRAQKLCMQDAIEGWLKLGRVKPTIDDLTGGLTWTGADLFGELAVQIALAAKALDGQVFCIARGNAYQPKRRVIRCGFNYCQALKCQREAAAQRAKRYLEIGPCLCQASFPSLMRMKPNPLETIARWSTIPPSPTKTACANGLNFPVFEGAGQDPEVSPVPIVLFLRTVLYEVVAELPSKVISHLFHGLSEHFWRAGRDLRPQTTCFCRNAVDSFLPLVKIPGAIQPLVSHPGGFD